MALVVVEEPFRDLLRRGTLRVALMCGKWGADGASSGPLLETPTPTKFHGRT